jgi:ubiquinone/menaquinone biosynthesis C-methylase UbiE
VGIPEIKGCCLPANINWPSVTHFRLRIDGSQLQAEDCRLKAANCRLPTANCMTYDNVAFFYDALARLIFGRQQLTALEFLIRHIPENARVLIVGGGSGWILESIARQHPTGLSITYIDASGKMVALAKKKNTAGNNITFITADIAQTQLNEGSFDVVITPFLFDNFTQPVCDEVFNKLHLSLCKNGTWLFTDFQQTTLRRHQLLLRAMYLFFRITSGIKARQLPDTGGLFAAAGYSPVAQAQLMGGFIVATVYKH